MANEKKDRLLWRRSEARDMFKNKRLWPTFVGANLDPIREARGLLPVFQWPEQQMYLQQFKEMPSSSGIGSKRKLTADDDEVDNDNKNEQQKKKQKSSYLTSNIVVQSCQYIYRNVVNAVSSSFGWFLTGNSDEKVVNQEAKKDNSVIMEALPTSISTPTTITTTPAAEPVSLIGLSYYERAKYTVFKSLQDKQYFIGPADVYGGDYSIYKGGDPSQSHSTGVVRVLSKRMVSAKDILAFSRVQNQVAKSTVFAYCKPKKVANITKVAEAEGTTSSACNAPHTAGEAVITSEEPSGGRAEVDNPGGIPGGAAIEGETVLTTTQPQEPPELEPFYVVINFKAVSDRT